MAQLIESGGPRFDSNKIQLAMQTLASSADICFYLPNSTIVRNEQWLDGTQHPSDGNFKWWSRRSESHPCLIPGNLPVKVKCQM